MNERPEAINEGPISTQVAVQRMTDQFCEMIENVKRTHRDARLKRILMTHDGGAINGSCQMVIEDHIRIFVKA